MTTPPPAITFENVGVTLNGTAILDSVTAHAPAGGSTAILGPNGAGKTTLILALLGEVPYRGRILFAGGERRPRIGYVPQKLEFDSGLPLTVMEFICLGWQRLPLWFGVRRRHRLRAARILAAVGVGELGARRVGELSGGELRRVLLALALGRDPELLVLDEPTAGVDAQGELAFHQLLKRLRAERGFTQIMVNHDIDAVLQHATHAIILNRRVLSEGSPEQAIRESAITSH